MSSKFIDFYTQLIGPSDELNILKNSNGLLTTDEEFNKMENAVNNLLITKKQIDNLNNEKNSLMQLYENKINEQNEQIKYLQEENFYLKKLLDEQNLASQTDWRNKYELCLDNIMRQLLNNLKIQETIRAEFLKFEETDIDLQRENSYICTSDSWTFNNVNNRKAHRMQELLMQQQKQQLNLLNELSEVSKSLKSNCYQPHNLNHSLTNSSLNKHETTKFDKLVAKTDSDTSSQTNLLNSSTNSSNSQRSNPRPSRIPKYNRNQKLYHLSTNSDSETKNSRYLSNTKIPQRKPQQPQQQQQQIAMEKTTNKNTSVKNVSNYQTYTKRKNSTENKMEPKIINSKTFDKNAQNSSLITECKEVKLFMNNKNLVDILLVPKNSDPKLPRPTRDDEGYSTMSSEIMHRTQTSNRTSSNNTESRTSGASSTIDETNSLTSSIQTPVFRNCKKRYCFPTLKSFNYYYNNRYYHQYHKNESQSSIVCCKYLSDTDIQSLSNQLNSYDKDLCFNVYHLDTLYNNVDYILFNSYASDTELVYNYNRRNGRHHNVLDSNYQLYINDYFNQPYDDEEDQDEIGENTLNSEQQFANQSDENNESNFMEYELKEEDEYQFELDYSNQNLIELSVDDDVDGLLFDDEDVNLLLNNDNENDFCLNEYKNMFEKSNLDSPLIFSSQSLSSLKTTSCSSSSCDYPSTNNLSIDSINAKNKLEESSNMNQEYFIDSIDNYEDYQLHDVNQILVDENEKILENFDLDNFVDQLNKQCKADKMLMTSEITSKKLKELTIKETSRVVKNGNLPEKNIEKYTNRPIGTSLVRRHTITTMPISAACFAHEKSLNEIEKKILTPGCQTPSDSPSKYIDTKAYVGSFTNPVNSRQSTPLRRAETVYKKHTFIPPDKNSFTYTKGMSSVGSTPVKVKNNFNNDFYRLCSDTFYEGSEHNFMNNNSNESNNSILLKFKQQLEPEHLDDLQSNVASHVNNLFDQWLINSKN